MKKPKITKAHIDLMKDLSTGENYFNWPFSRLELLDEILRYDEDFVITYNGIVKLTIKGIDFIVEHERQTKRRELEKKRLYQHQKRSCKNG